MAYAPTDPSIFSKRGLILVGIVVLHVVFFWGLNASMSQGLIKKILGPIETRIIEAPPETEETPPPPPPKIETPPPFVPPPDVAIEIPADAPPAKSITQTTTERPVTRPPPAPPKKVVTQPKSNPRRPLSQPEYPPSSRRAGEAGTVILDVYVLENGRVGEARVRKSSGYPRLDEAAVREVKRSWRLEPGTEDGKPVAMWGQFAVTFKLTD